MAELHCFMGSRCTSLSTFLYSFPGSNYATAMLDVLQKGDQEAKSTLWLLQMDEDYVLVYGKVVVCEHVPSSV